jgi:hypothetical protein
MKLSRFGRKLITIPALALLMAALLTGTAMAASKTYTFEMGPSLAAQDCLPNAKAKVKVTSIGPVEIMNVEASGLPPKTEFDTFVIQVPNKPFGLAWYQGDLETNGSGKGSQHYIGRFNIETFAVAVGSVKAPKVHEADAGENPSFAPVHTYHVGLWFNSPEDAKKAGCPADVTPFNGDHNAGIQVLTTRDFLDDQGPLRNIGS